MRAPASRASPSVIFPSTSPAPTATVSAEWASSLSPSAPAAAMPPCAHAVEAPWPSGAAEITMTGRGASFNAQNSPARPPPMMTTSVLRVRSSNMSTPSAHRPRESGYDGAISILQVDHPLDRMPCLLGNRRVDNDFLAQINQAVQNLGQRDPLHVRTQIARPYHFDIRHLDLDIIGHGAFADHHDALGMVVAYPVDHVRGRAGEVGFGQHIGRTFRMGDDLHRRIGLAIGAQFVAGKALMHLAGALPGA